MSLLSELRDGYRTLLASVDSWLETVERQARDRALSRPCGPFAYEQALAAVEEEQEVHEPRVFDAVDHNAVELLKIDPDAYFRITKLQMPKSVRDHAIARALDDAAEARSRKVWDDLCPHGLDNVVFKCADCQSSAASAAADPSVTDSPDAVTGEGPGADSGIPQPVAPGQPQCQAGHRHFHSFSCTKPYGHSLMHGYAGCFWPESEATDPELVGDVEADPGEVGTPSPGEHIADEAERSEFMDIDEFLETATAEELAAMRHQHATAAELERHLSYFTTAPGASGVNPGVVAQSLLETYHITPK